MMDFPKDSAHSLVKQFDKLKFARLANTVSRFSDALTFIQDHFT